MIDGPNPYLCVADRPTCLIDPPGCAADDPLPFRLGRLVARLWQKNIRSRPDLEVHLTETNYKEPATGKTMRFSDAASRRMDNFVRLSGGPGSEIEIKASPRAA